MIFNFKLLLLFVRNEVKEFINFFRFLIAILKEINLIKYLNSKISNRLYLGIFNNNYLNKYLDLTVKLNKNLSSSSNKKPILVEGFINQPEYQIYNVIIAKKLSEIIKTNIIGILRKGDFKARKIFESYGIREFIYIHDGNFITRFINLIKSIIILKNIKNIKKLLKLKYDGIDIGKCLYEQFLRFEKRPYVYSVEPIYYIYLSKLLIHNNQFKKIYSQNKSSFLVQSETQYFPLRTSFQVALLNKIKIVCRCYRGDIGIRIYWKLREADESRMRIPKDIFKKIYTKINSKFKSKNFKKYINKKIKINIGKDHYQLIDNKNSPNKYFKNKKELLKYFNFDDKPLVLILAHEFTDGNLAHSWNLYENDMLWLEDTIDQIKKIKNVNWIIKSHPSEKIYNAKISTEKIFNSKVKSIKNIKLFPEKYRVDNFYKFVNAVLTSHGTAAHEYPLYSIPTIICGDANCSGLGFTIEPKKKNEYYKILNNIYKLKKIKLNEVRKCWIFNYITNYLTLEEIPFITDKLTIRSNYNPQHFWKNYLIYLKKNKKYFDLNKLKDSINLSLKNKDKIMINYNKI